MTRKDDKGDQPSGGETTWTNTGATRYGRGQHKTGSFGDDRGLRPTMGHNGCLMMMMMILLRLNLRTVGYNVRTCGSLQRSYQHVSKPSSPTTIIN